MAELRDEKRIDRERREEQIMKREITRREFIRTTAGAAVAFFLFTSTTP